MLDSDASFFLVPEFQSSRGARRTSRAPLSDLRFGPETGADLAFAPMPVPGILGLAERPASAEGSAKPVPTTAPAEDFLSLSAAVPSNGSDLRIQHHADHGALLDDAPLYPSQNPAPTPADSAQTPIDDMPDTRAVTPRRPMRFTFARDAAEPGRIALPIQNLFDGVFDESALTGPDIDPRLQRSRARAVARLAAHEAALPPEARNLFCDDGSDDQAAPSPDAPCLTVTATTAASDGADGTAPRRAVRHLSVTRRTPKPKADPAAIHDPLQDHLHQVRDALYAPDPEAEAEIAASVAAQQPPLPLRVLAVLLTLAFTLVQLLPPLRALLAQKSRHLLQQVTKPLSALLFAALSSIAPRLPARAMAITGTVFLLAQTLPPYVM